MLDKCEEQVIRAFQKDGWKIERKPYTIRGAARTIVADFGLEHASNHHNQHVVVIEVKCFSRPLDDLQEFYTAIGQYLFYRTALTLDYDTNPLYLVIPHDAYQRFQQDPIMMTTFTTFDINIVIIDLEEEEVLQWLH